MWEKILVPLALVVVYVLLSGGFMFGVQGGTPRMRIVLRAAVLFVAVMVYSMAWHKELASFLGFAQAWILTTILGAGVAVIFARHQFHKSEGGSSSSEAR